MASSNRVRTRIETVDGRRIEPMDGRRSQLDGNDAAGGEPAIRDLIKQLAAQSSDLVRGEVSLAKLEMRDMARQVAVDSAKLGAAVALAFAGALALVAAAVIGLGVLLDGRYALSALIVGVVVLAIGGLLARAGLAGLASPPKPEATVESVKESGEWARQEVREFRDEIRS
ncbi:MAG TPA: phage holin family protein [Longimicrobiales bacterium]|nr:phage holin family protein [Longimicrobiales bacterium]